MYKIRVNKTHITNIQTLNAGALRMMFEVDMTLQYQMIQHEQICSQENWQLQSKPEKRKQRNQQKWKYH